VGDVGARVRELLGSERPACPVGVGLILPDPHVQHALEQDPEADAAAIHADRARLFLGFRVPIAWQRRLARGHGFTRGEVEGEVRPLVARTPFGKLEIGRSGSCLRLELRK